jgi:hypothetical protein
MTMTIDWQQIILNLLHVSTPQAIESATGISRQRLKDMQEPLFSEGIELLNIHFDLCPDLHTHEFIFINKKV